MKKAIFSGLSLALCLFCLPAQAFQSPAKTDSPEYLTLKHAGEHYQPVAETFGCGKFAFASLVAGGKIADLEYVPEGTKSVEDWTRLVTVTMYALSGQPETDVKLMDGILDGLMEQYQKADASIVRRDDFKTAGGDPGMYIEYAVGEGAFREHNAGVFMRASSTTAVFIQIQSRGQALAPADADKVRALIQPAGGARP